MVNRALDLVLVGPPGAGKGTQGRKLAQAFGLLHVSIGEMLRSEVIHNSELGTEARDYLDSGKLVPDGLARRMLLRNLHSQPGAMGCVLDGYPRTVHQADLLDGLLAQLGRRVDAALLLDVPDRVARERMAADLACQSCGRTQNAAGGSAHCAVCGGELRPKSEGEKAADGRLAAWREHEAAVLDLFRSRGILREVDGVGSEADVFTSLRQALESVLRP